MGRGDLCTGFWWGNPRNRDHLEDTNVDERITLRWIFREWDGSVDWVELAQDRDRWRAVLNEVVTLRVP
jgi:hypothetical protein